MSDDEQAGVVGFDGSARLLQSLTTDHERVNESISDLSAGGGTSIAPGLRKGVDELERNSTTDRPAELILLSDGKSDDEDEAIDVAERASRQNIEINTVGLGDGVDKEALQAIADATGGGFYHVEASDDLPETFERIANSPRDSDNDGLPNKLEESGIPVGIGSTTTPDVVTTDPYDADTDGDGLADGEEIGEYTEVRDRVLGVDVTYYKLKSDPTDIDSDDDEVNDYEERRVWETDPLDADTDGDGLIDFVDPEPKQKTYPPEFEYQSWNWQTATEQPLLGPTAGGPDQLEVVARPTGAADEIEEITVNQYVDSSVPYMSGWRNETYTGDSLEETAAGDGVYVNTRFGDGTGTFSPSEIHITVTDDDGNRGAVSEYTDEDIIDVTAGVSSGDTAAALGAGAAASSPGYAGGSVVISSTAVSASALLGGAVLAGGTYAFVLDETAGSASGEFSQREFVQPVPITEPLWEGEVDGLEITLPSGVAFEHEIHDGHERKHGWEQIKELPEINQPEDIAEIIRAPNAIEEDGRYDLIIGDNPNGDGKIILRALMGILISASAYDTVEDPLGREVYLDKDEEHAIREGKDMTYEELKDAIKNPDEIWEGSYEDFYLKEMPDGTWRIIKVYTAGGVTRFVSTVIPKDTREEVEEYITQGINELLRKIYPQ